MGSSVVLKGFGNIAFQKGDYKEAERLYRLAYQSDSSTNEEQRCLSLQRYTKDQRRCFWS
ncbi:hypothetical protein B0H65DRAFT_471361 [Neurospora tetraspora]|uniref:Uncharacterized protein n=1 Tax=Neurospora tetraspora TaxID=94610 RepID=A0AAE0JA21_9PEZI|nr:hypothetical protein B0H65DRAFT_471361 [Neurospora tetraspora]